MKAIKPIENSKYKYQNRYPTAYAKLETALDLWAEDHDLKGLTYPELAKDVISFCNITFNYIPNRQERIANFLQGLGLHIPFYNVDIEAMAIKDGFLKESDSDRRKLQITDNYWNFMSMRLIHISESKK